MFYLWSVIPYVFFTELFYSGVTCDDVAVESMFGIWNLGGNVWRRTGLFCVKNGFRCDEDCTGVNKFHVVVAARE